MKSTQAIYRLHTDGGYYVLAANGTILFDSSRNYRSDSEQWRVIGIGKRHHSRDLISLSEAADGADFGQGWVHDLDHGTHRIWGMPHSRRARQVVRLDN